MYVERGIKESFKKLLGVYDIIAVVGARQAGKTTFLKEEMKNFNSSYIMFDDPDARTLFEEDIKKFEKQYVGSYELSVLDEVQYCNNAGRNLKYLADVGKKLWITSSSEIILGKNVLSYLVGRVSVIRLYPFSLPEFLAAKGQKETTQKILERNIWEHITYGGYPKVVTTGDAEMKKVILKDLYDTMMLKDVALTFSIEDIRTLDEFARYLSVNIGGIISYETISKHLKISFQTLKKYLDAAEKSYILARVQPFHTNKRKEITKQPKVYFIDTGLRNAVAKAFDAELSGSLFENYVFSELLKMGFTPKYWRSKSKAEVDFVIEINGKILPIEAKLGAEPAHIDRSMRSFIDSYAPKNAMVVMYKGTKGDIMINECKLIFTDVPGMRKFLLNMV